MPKKKTSLIRSSDFKTIYAVGAIGTWTPYDFRINFYSEKVVEDEEEAYVNDTQIILSPKATKEFAYWLMKNINEYEATYGTSKDIETTKRESDVEGEAGAGKEPMFKGAFKDNLKEDIKNEIMGYIRKYLKQNLQDDIRKDLKVVPTPQLKKDLRKDLKADLKQDLRKDMKPELRKDLKKVLKADLKHDLREDLKKDIREELRRDLHAISAAPQKLKPKPKVKAPPPKGKVKTKTKERPAKKVGKKKK